MKEELKERLWVLRSLRHKGGHFGVILSLEYNEGALKDIRILGFFFLKVTEEREDWNSLYLMFL